MKTKQKMDKKIKTPLPIKPKHQEEDPDEPTYPPPGQPPYPEVEPYEIPEEDPYRTPPIEIPIGITKTNNE